MRKKLLSGIAFVLALSLAAAGCEAKTESAALTSGTKAADVDSTSGTKATEADSTSETKAIDTASTKEATAKTEEKALEPKELNEAVNLMDGISADAGEKKSLGKNFITPAADFSIKLFQQSVEKDKNSMISPLSVMLALSMTANGAKNETLAEMEKTLGGKNDISKLNQYLYSLSEGLASDDEKCKLSIANSIWFRDEDLTVNDDFLETNAKYYDSAIYKLKFDDKAKDTINAWVYNNTDGMIDKIIDGINPDAAVYLINAIAFDSDWEKIYKETSVYDGYFTDLNGDTKTVSMMNSEEYRYIDDGKATGFIKPYAGGKFSFVALLPNEGTSVDDYIASMTGDGFVEMVRDAEWDTVITTMPKFKSEYGLVMNDALNNLGIKQAFDDSEADFTGMARSPRGNIFINQVIHKTFIEVNERGTKASAVTAVEMTDECVSEELKYVILDRPFVYAIVDNDTNLPIFIGTVLEVEQ